MTLLFWMVHLCYQLPMHKSLPKKCAEAVLVLSAGETEKEGIIKAKEALGSAQVFIIGAEVNYFELDRDHY